MIRSFGVFVLASSFFGCSSSSAVTGHVGNAPGGTDASTLDASPGVDASVDAGSPDVGGDGTPGDDAMTTDATPGDDGGSEAGDDSSTGDDGGFPPPPGPVCSTTPTWRAGVVLSVSTASDDALDAVTPDELTIAWTIGSGGTATVAYADRASTSAPFGAPQLLAAGQFTTDRVALSQDGLRLVAVNADGQGFSEMTRSTRSSPGNTFGAAAVGTYANLDAAGALASGESYGDPVLSADDRAFYYSIYGGSVAATIFRTARIFAGDAWPPGAPLDGTSALAAQGALRRRPTAISSDEQTLFFWDEVTGIERAAWIDESTGAFDVFADLGTMASAGPNAACTELYFSSAGASSVDLFSSSN